MNFRTSLADRLLLPAALLLACLGLVACGGGGGGSVSPPLPTVDFGLVAASTPTTIGHAFVNPFDEAATPRVASATGGFTVVSGTLPGSAAGDSAANATVRFTPPGPGTYSGVINIEWTSGGSIRVESQTFAATAEPMPWSIVPSSLDFGILNVGTTLDRTVTVTNGSTMSTATLTGTSTSGPGMSLVLPTLPLVIAPGASAVLTLRYAPTAEGSATGNFVVGPTDAGAPISIPVTASTPGGASETIENFGSQSFNGSGLTPQMTVSVPAHAISVQIEAIGTANATFGLGELIGPGGRVYENTSSTGSYIWLPSSGGVFNAQVPNTDRTAVQLVSGGGDYTFRISRLGGGASSVNVRVLIETRPGGTSTADVLPLNVYLTPALPVSAATAAGDTRLQNILSRMSTILAGQGITVGAITYYDVTDARYDEVTSAEFPDLLALSSMASEERLNLFFVSEAIGGGVVGVSGAIGGPKRNGTEISGVMSIYSGFTTNTVGLICAHEVGHFLGLFHTVEQNGSHDFIDDTDECPATGAGSSGDCNGVVGGGYLMHWQAVGGIAITPGQGTVLRGHPLVDPAPGGSSKPGPAFATMSSADRLEVFQLGSGWCGTCNAQK